MNSLAVAGLIESKRASGQGFSVGAAGRRSIARDKARRALKPGRKRCWGMLRAPRLGLCDGRYQAGRGREMLENCSCGQGL
ncbi:hypothetical protein F2A38_30695 [Pseudomonas chlororaphis]|uniref:Uncharacterized protein n=1 Tax=Pseudomonas chlororaphis TaxID=587753 RepID=A0AB34BW44_9PSED|nr:hypothetical protein F2A38_30695 [Pseudomonas chlororaphis]ORM47720.1 hypothetical protein B6D51_14500 [Pseudomonas chlororaphis subsp. chlororaphis]TWR90659.1 hypothetical protein FJD36_26660 [Pseudomonas chlororaphis subsp. chlororaphis]